MAKPLFMKWIGKLIFWAGILCFIPEVSAQNPHKIMSYNIRNAKGMDQVCDYSRIAKIILQSEADVIALQEIDSMTRRSQHQDVLREIAHRTGLYATFAPAIDFEGGKYGIGILSKKQPLRVQRYALPGSEEARALLIAEFKDYYFACTHLSLTEEDRLSSLHLIKQVANQYNKPFYLAGDFNAEPNSSFMELLMKDFAVLNDMQQKTFPAPMPEITIDYIVVYPQKAAHDSVIHTEVLNEPVASDHRPVMITLSGR